MVKTILKALGKWPAPQLTHCRIQNWISFQKLSTHLRSGDNSLWNLWVNNEIFVFWNCLLHFQWSLRGKRWYCSYNCIVKGFSELCESPFSLKAVIWCIRSKSFWEWTRAFYLATKICVCIYQCPIMHIRCVIGKFSFSYSVQLPWLFSFIW